MANAINYYKSFIIGDLEPIDLLPFASSTIRRPLKRYSTHESRLRLPSSVTAKLKALAREHKSTSFHIHLATLQSLLFRLLPNSESFYIGITDANRLDKNFVRSLGNFLNLLPLKFERPESGATFCTVVQRARDQVYKALEHSIVPFDVLLDELSVQRSNSYAPIFQVLIDYRLVVQKPDRWADCKIVGEKWHTARIGYDIGLEVVDNPSGDTELVLRLQDSLYSKESTNLLLRSYVHALQQFASTEDLCVRSIAPWSEEDIQKVCQVGRGR